MKPALNIILSVGVLLALVVGAAYVGMHLDTSVPAVGSNAFQSSYFAVSSTTTTVSVTASTRVLATSTPTQRVYASICNASAATPIVLRLDGDKAADERTAGGIRVAAGACFTINDQNLYTGSVQASSTVGAVNVLVNDYEL